MRREFILRARLFLCPALLWACLSLGVYSARAHDGPVLFVAPDGTVGAEGAKNDPLPGLAAARDAVRALKEAYPESDITVYLRGGDYFIGETVTFTPEDSAQPGTTITYRSYRDERPVFSAGIPVTGWERPTSFPEGLPDKARDHVMAASFPEGVDSVLTLFDAEGRLPRTLGPEHKPALDRTQPEVADRKTLHFEPGAMRDYANLQDIEIWIVPTFQWCHNILPLESLDLEKGIARTRVMGIPSLDRREMDLTAEFPAWLAERLREDYDEPLVIEGLNSP